MDYLTYRWTNIVQLLYTTNISVDLAHQKIFHAKVGKGGINFMNVENFNKLLFKLKEAPPWNS